MTMVRRFQYRTDIIGWLFLWLLLVMPPLLLLFHYKATSRHPKFMYTHDKVEEVKKQIQKRSDAAWLQNEFRPLMYHVVSSHRAGNGNISAAASSETEGLKQKRMMEATIVALVLANPFLLICLARLHRSQRHAPRNYSHDLADRVTRLPSIVKVLGVIGLVVAEAWLFLAGWWIWFTVVLATGLGFSWLYSNRPIENSDSKSGRDSKGWEDLFHAAICLLVLAVVLAACVIYTYGRYEGKYPTLEEERSCALCLDDKEVASSTAEASSDYLEVRAARVEAQPSIHLLGRRRWQSPLAWTYLVGRLYILMATLCLLLWLRQLCRERDSADVCFRLITVIVSYISVGFVFGVLYHLLYVSDAARYNWFADCFFERKVNERPVDAGSTLDKASTSALLGLLRARAQVTTTFAQDRPRFVANGINQEGDEEWSGTFRFATKSGHVFAHGDLDSNDVCKSDSDACTVNYKTVTDFERYLKRRAERPYSVRDTVRVRLFGGADSKYARENRQFAEDRQVGAKLRLLRELEAFPRQESNPQIQAIKGALDRSELSHRFIEPAESDGSLSAKERLGLLWPRGVDSPNWSPEERHARWRAASIRLLVFKADIANASVEMRGSEDGPALEDMLYFSFAAFTTTGFGDVRPVSRAARFCVILENILQVGFFGAFFAVVLRNSRAKTAGGGEPRD